MDTSDIILQLALLLCVFGALYLVLVRPQQLRLQQHKLMLANLQRGDRVATNGGLVGTITSIDVVEPM